MPKLHPMGFIIGGNCDRLHKERSTREAAVPEIVMMILEEGLIVPAGNGKYRVAKLPKSFGFQKVMAFGGGSAQKELAAWRVLQTLLPALRKQSKSFTLKRLKHLASEIQKFTFDIGGSLDPIRIVGALNPPHYPRLYEKRKAAGHFV